MKFHKIQSIFVNKMKPRLFRSRLDAIILGAPALFCGLLWMYYRDQKYIEPERSKKRVSALVDETKQ